MTTPPKKALWKMLLPAVLLVGAVVVGLSLLKASLPVRTPEAVPFELEEGAEVPDFALSPVEGGETRLSQIQGKVFLLNFWATWCEACMTELPSISKLREAYKDRGFEVLGFNLDEEPQEAATTVRNRLGIRFPIFSDPQGKVSDLFDVHGIPMTIIVDRKGKVLLLETGERDWFEEDTRKRVEGWLSQ